MIICYSMPACKKGEGEGLPDSAEDISSGHLLVKVL